MAGTDARCRNRRPGTIAREELEPLTHMERQYVRVFIVWLSVLAALYIFQELFS